MNRREALCSIGMGAALGAVSAGAVYAAVPNDPAVPFFSEILAAERLMDGVDSRAAEAAVMERYDPLCQRIHDNDFPKPTTAKGAAMALRQALANEDFLEIQERNLIHAALAYLEGGAG